MNVIERWECGECNNIYHSYGMAAECCLDREDEEEEE